MHFRYFGTVINYNSHEVACTMKMQINKQICSRRVHKQKRDSNMKVPCNVDFVLQQPACWQPPNDLKYLTPHLASYQWWQPKMRKKPAPEMIRSSGAVFSIIVFTDIFCWYGDLIYLRKWHGQYAVLFDNSLTCTRWRTLYHHQSSLQANLTDATHFGCTIHAQTLLCHAPSNGASHTPSQRQSLRWCEIRAHPYGSGEITPK